MRYSEIWPKYAAWWDRMTIKPARAAEFNKEATTLLAGKQIYQEVEAATTSFGGRVGVKWYHIAVLHMREAGGNFSCYLGNGQPLARRTTLVPKNRGPFLGPRAFIDGCLDALAIDGLSKVLDWRLEKMLYYAELFNGTGYYLHGLPSPYLWGGTNIQRPGKYVADGRFRSDIWDTQPGCAPLLATLASLDSSIQFERET
jgi:lysozyme family protein